MCGCITHHPPKSNPSRPPWHRQKAPREPTLRPGGKGCGATVGHVQNEAPHFKDEQRIIWR